ncbi:MAG: polysaccharide deacetylase family protein [Eubacterium sp.]|nr:polysaccharide deacetylase family protein [Eubacterium sp.]
MSLTIIMYHYVRDIDRSRYPHIKGVERDVFEEQVKYIRDHFTPVRMEDVLEAAQFGVSYKLPEDAALLTFDDGYIDHYTVAFPILKRYGMQGAFFPVTMAVREHKLLDVNKVHFILAEAENKGDAGIKCLVKDCYDLIDKYRVDGRVSETADELYEELAVANRWDPGEIIFVKRLLQNRLAGDVRSEMASTLFDRYVGVDEETFAGELYMNPDQMKVMKDGGMFFGIHGSGHIWMNKTDIEVVEQDVSEAVAYFSSDEFGADGGLIDPDCWVVNYPFGGVNDEVVRIAKSLGAALGLTCEARDADIGRDDPYLLPRWDTNDLYPRGKNR